MAVWNGQICIRRATVVDPAGFAAWVTGAYQHYIERIGRLPGPRIKAWRRRSEAPRPQGGASLLLKQF